MSRLSNAYAQAKPGLYEMLMPRYNQRLFRVVRSVCPTMRKRKTFCRRHGYGRTSTWTNSEGLASFRPGLPGSPCTKHWPGAKKTTLDAAGETRRRDHARSEPATGCFGYA